MCLQIVLNTSSSDSEEEDDELDEEEEEETSTFEALRRIFAASFSFRISS